tara:strand:- start:48429 stop:48860 length:432 start_codon:yes stop_codon:yes gene_type:complete
MRSFMVIAGLLIVIGFIGSNLSTNGSGDEPDSQYEINKPEKEAQAAAPKKEPKNNEFGFIDKSSAYYVCEQLVKKRLKKPATAVFPRASGNKFQNTFKDGDGAQVHSYVDSENSYGTTVRTGFSCWVEEPSEDNWVVKKLEMD